MRDWQNAAPRWIANIHRDNPDATPTELRKLLRAEAHNFHGGTSWGKKVWSKHCNAYLAKLTGKGATTARAIKWPDDIVFPWRGESAA